MCSFGAPTSLYRTQWPGPLFTRSCRGESHRADDPTLVTNPSVDKPTNLKTFRSADDRNEHGASQATNARFSTVEDWPASLGLSSNHLWATDRLERARDTGAGSSVHRLRAAATRGVYGPDV